MVAIADGKPQQMGLLDIIACYTNYQRDVVYNRTKFQLKKAKERAHILEGLIIAIKNIDEVVAIIKNRSPRPKRGRICAAVSISPRCRRTPFWS